MDLKTALILIKNTIASLEIKATADNCDKILGCTQMIDKIVATLDERTVKKNDGNGEGENVPG